MKVVYCLKTHSTKLTSSITIAISPDRCKFVIKRQSVICIFIYVNQRYRYYVFSYLICVDISQHCYYIVWERKNTQRRTAIVVFSVHNISDPIIVYICTYVYMYIVQSVTCSLQIQGHMFKDHSLYRRRVKNRYTIVDPRLSLWKM